LPRLKCTFREVIEIIEANGFEIVPSRTSGSHRQYMRTSDDGETRLVTVAYHNINDDVLPDTLSSMIRQSGLPKRLFRK
jgi:predicted RNA binding protein YcfA (HicA-like mRNA interferase family)